SEAGSNARRAAAVLRRRRIRRPARVAEGGERDDAEAVAELFRELLEEALVAPEVARREEDGALGEDLLREEAQDGGDTSIIGAHERVVEEERDTAGADAEVPERREA